MDEGIYAVRPIYRSGVKTSDWYEEHLQYPLDFPHPKSKGGSHYKTLGPTDEVFIPKTSAKEAMEQGRQVTKTLSKGVRHPLVNFTSFPLINTERTFGNLKEYDLPEPKLKILEKHISTYQRSYCSQQAERYKRKKDCCKDEVLHPLFNRRPKNDFEMACYSSENKFMDDHFFNPSEARKCSNFLKHIRNVSFNPWLGAYQ